ncbi:MAG TPA: tRNA (N(6)-L-threonylcarbamoyladenosine(37)-C(2))-methylthiotransferase MtaB [Candidatus Marinimicrobia bacterium]|nr:tRNA (N(6)-L-threonylcarbamoyladenosine(37)-C(2))-methylthiotransferase MtaB [Candidatus Neomarinimicrobiota bacterium]HRS50924.1 tRNA (N(6)-L-threonylcarbamoyladenosine(37)-C(2))-methylthiotransferase MtaB [Candidatus Neomarinimicrobiota bacterium]HRU91734.1 tRNA (N(6)-L-threonylcarbamoyladenosine(37)-C(2))-methylthiotransferase MtaB [Candidatus Neomarinimicrobiota bacterium]
MIATVAFRTLGCRLNQAETDAIKAELANHNLRIVNSNGPADLTIINSCAVTQSAEAKTRGAITAARRISPDGKIAVIGCYSQIAAAKLLNIPGVFLVLGNNEKYEILDFLETIERGEKIVRVDKPESPNTFRVESHLPNDKRIRANLKVQEGCDYYCAYCIVPYLRGKPRSRAPEDCIATASHLENQGVQEIVLTGINLGRYESLNGDLSFLIRRLLAETSLPRIRLSSIEPDLITEELIKLISAEPRLCRHLHIPLQHGSDTILAQMNRHYLSADYAALVGRIRQRIPEICLGADVMVGFPGETELEFGQMCQFLENLDINYLHVFRYSSRPGTPAGKFTDRIPDSAKKQRSEILRQLSRRKRDAFRQSMLGKTAPVLIEEKIAPGLWQSLTDNYQKVRIHAKENLLNQIRKVKLTHISEDYLEGELLGE